MERVQIRGLPEGNYQVQCKTIDNWKKLVETILPDCDSDGSIDTYYKFTEDGEWDLSSSKFEDVEEVSYAYWKEAIENHIRRVGDYKVGDLVYITKGYFDLSAGEIRPLEGFDGSHWWVKTKDYPKIYLDIGENFRHATKEEIAAQSNSPKPVSDLISDYTYSNIKGKKIAIHCPTQELWDKVIALIPNCRLNKGSAKEYGDRRCIHPCIWYGSYSPIEYYKGEGHQIITAEQFIAANEKKHESEPVVKKDGWKVGDKLPAEFLNLCTYYTDIHDIHSATNVEDDDVEKWIHDRVVKTVTSKGWADISGALHHYLSPKHEYPEYEHYEQVTPTPSKREGKDPLQIPVGWKPGDSWTHRDGTCGLSISVHPKDDDFNSYFVDFGETGTSWRTVENINEFVAEGFWIINPEQKSKEKEKEEKQSQTIIFNQTNTKTKQDEKGNSISISSTEQCFITSGSYKFSKATYVPGDEERITKGQRRQGSTVRG